MEVARAAGEAVRPHARLRRLVVGRLDRTVATGFLLTLALSVTLLGGLALGVLAFLVRRVAFIQRFDNVVAAWGYDHRSATSTNGLHALTDLGRLEVVVVLALALVAFAVIRWRDRWSFLFLLTVLVGMEAIMLGVKDLVGRVRPTLDPAAASLGPSFPSGHSSTAAAFYAAAALICRAPPSTAGASDRDRGVGRGCGRRRSEPRPARLPLALGRDRRPLARLGLVRALQRRLRRTAAYARPPASTLRPKPRRPCARFALRSSPTGEARARSRPRAIAVTFNTVSQPAATVIADPVPTLLHYMAEPV